MTDTDTDTHRDDSGRARVNRLLARGTSRLAQLLLTVRGLWALLGFAVLPSLVILSHDEWLAMSLESVFRGLFVTAAAWVALAAPAAGFSTT